MSNREWSWMARVPSLVLAVVGCGKTITDTGGVPVGEAPTEIAQTVCAKAYDCCSPAQLMGNDLAGTDEPSCEQKTGDAYKSQLSAIQSSQDRYRSVYDGAKLDACLATIRTTSCQDLAATNHFSGIPGCDSFVQPRVALGGTCDYDWECQQSQCHHQPGAAEGACAPFAAVGEGCADSKCAPGLLCDSQDMVCATAVADGAACMRGDQCASGSCNQGSCGARPSGTCFYSSGCALGGGGRPAASSQLGALALVAAAAFIRRRRVIRRGAGTAP